MKHKNSGVGVGVLEKEEVSIAPRLRRMNKNKDRKAVVLARNDIKRCSRVPFFHAT